MAQGDVLGDSEGGDELEVLVDHADAQIDGRLRVGDGHCLPSQQDLARVGRFHAVENFHQRGFASAVFTHQGVDFPLLHGQVHPVVGNDAGESLGDTEHLQIGHRSNLRDAFRGSRCPAPGKGFKMALLHQKVPGTLL